MTVPGNIGSLTGLASFRRGRILPVLDANAVISAVDLGDNCAFAACVPGHRPQWARTKLGGKDFGERGLNLWHWLNEMFARFEPAIVFTEEPYIDMRFKSAAMSLFGMRAILWMCATQHKIRYQQYEIAKVCRFFTGRGNWGGRDQKKESTMKMCRLYGFGPETYDESDVLAVLMYGEALVAPQASQRRGIGPLFIPK